MNAPFDPQAFFVPANRPECSAQLGWEFVSWDEETSTLRVAFDGKPEFANPAGLIQGGFLSAMIDDSMGPAVIVKSRGRTYATTIDLHTHFLRPVKPGRIEVAARITQMGRAVVYTEAELFDARGRKCARATSSMMIVSNPFAAAKPADA
jgi:uncharacterized protein (TIGR00369 family)